MSFSYEDTIIFLEDFEKIKESKAHRILRNLFKDEGFKEWLFNPPQKYENLNVLVNKLYERITKPKIMRAIADMIQEEGYDEFDRTTAAFITSIVNVAVKANNDQLTEFSTLRKENRMSEDDFEKLRDKLIKINDIVLRLQKCAIKIVKRRAKKIEEEVNLPRNIIRLMMSNVPGEKYIDKFKVGFYLNNILNSTYAELEKSDYNNLDIGLNTINWRALFKEIFGKQNIVEAATFILLEGMHRIDQFKSHTVRACWDSLTAFALRELETAPDTIREQMLDLYVKRIDKMFSNRTFDLRYDMRTIDEFTFPNLAKTIDGYKDRINEILRRGKENK